MALGSLFGARERRQLTYQSLWLSDQLSPSATLSGVSLGQRQALALEAVFAAVHRIADPICTLPVGTFVRRNGERRPVFPRPAWIDQPDPDPSVQRSDHFQQVLVSLLLDGNYYGRILRSGAEVLAISPLDPTRVEPKRNAQGFVEFHIDGGSQVLASRDVVHITELRKPGALKGTSRIHELRETFGIGRALDEYVARYFGQGSIGQRLSVEVPGDLTEEQADTLKARLMGKLSGLSKSHEPWVVSGGAKVSRLSDNAEQAQLNEAREFFTLVVARAFNIPPSRMGVNTPGTRAFASVEQDAIDFQTVTLAFYVAKIEEAYSRLLILPEQFIKFNMDALVRGDIQSRYAAYNSAIDAGWMLMSEARRREDLPFIEGTDVLRVPLENVSIGAAGLVEDEKKVTMAAQLVQAGFDPAAVLAALDLPAIPHNGLPSVQQQAVEPPSNPSDDQGAQE